jgi:DnaJ-class molecular chaperone
MIRGFKFVNNPNNYRALSVAKNYKYNTEKFDLLLDDTYEIKYNKKQKYFYEEKIPFYKKKDLNHIIINDLSSVCHVCKGSGWITNNNINNGFNFGYEKCNLCNGTGFH